MLTDGPLCSTADIVSQDPRLVINTWCFESDRSDMAGDVAGTGGEVFHQRCLPDPLLVFVRAVPDRGAPSRHRCSQYVCTGGLFYPPIHYHYSG